MHVSIFSMHSTHSILLSFVIIVVTVKVCARCNEQKYFECLGGNATSPIYEGNMVYHNCIQREEFCDRRRIENCRDGSDERYCDKYKVNFLGGCPSSWFQCTHGGCIPSYWKCNGKVDCSLPWDDSDETSCVYPKKTEKIARTLSLPKKEVIPFEIALQRHVLLDSAKTDLINWFLGRRKDGVTNARWSSQLHRIATALYLSKREYFESEKKIQEEISYEIEIRLLSRLTGKKKLRRNELATYIHALLVLCIDPHKFHGHDLVTELRARVETNNQTNPFELLVLCNAGDKMGSDDVERAVTSFHSKRRAFWTENQAMALQSLSCVASQSEDLVEAGIMEGMALELKERQSENGTVDTVRTTAQVIQALVASNSNSLDFDFEAALNVILSCQKVDGSFGSLLDSYYILPVLCGTGLFGVSSNHCKTPISSEMDALHSYQSLKGDKIAVQYSIWIGEDVDLRNTLTLKMPVNSSLYDVIEMASKLDQKRKVQYSVIAGKPYVSSVADVQDDVAMNLYWSIFQRPSKSEEEPTLIQESPVDIMIRLNQEFILWYKDIELV